MTEATAPALESGPGEFLQLWSDSLSQVMGQITSAAVSCTVRREALADFPPAAEGDLWVAVTATGGLRGEMSLRLGAATVLQLAQIFLSEPATPEAQPTAEHRDAVIELLRQVANPVTAAAKARSGEIQLRIEAAAASPSWAPAATFWLQMGARPEAEDPSEESGGTAIEFALSAALVAELRAQKTEAAPAAADSAPPISPATTQTPGALDRLLDVQLAMTMRFGTKKLLLREVLDLSPGSVVELDRKIQEPVDLLLDGRLVARGEVVVIDGKYGLRVTDVSPLGTD
jgi:flagellar motor switch protein FliN/FliY